ncbi:MAG: hypothetical protein R2881_02225 [Eubacteriales bacterium]
MFNFGKLLVQTLVAWLGTSAIAANAIIGSIFNITIMYRHGHEPRDSDRRRSMRRRRRL